MAPETAAAAAKAQCEAREAATTTSSLAAMISAEPVDQSAEELGVAPEHLLEPPPTVRADKLPQSPAEALLVLAEIRATVAETPTATDLPDFLANWHIAADALSLLAAAGPLRIANRES